MVGLYFYVHLCISTVLQGSSENLRALDSCNRCMGFRSIILYFQLCVSPICDLCISGCIADGIGVSLMPSSWSGMDVSLLSTHPFTLCGDDRRAAGSGYTPSLKSKKNGLHTPLRFPLLLLGSNNKTLAELWLKFAIPVWWRMANS